LLLGFKKPFHGIVAHFSKLPLFTLQLISDILDGCLKFF